MKALNKILNNKFYVIIYLCLIAFTIRHLMVSYFDTTDGFFILATGKYILQNGIPKENPFFIQSGHKLIVQQWLWDVIMYWIFDMMGKAGLFISSLFTAFLTCLMFFKISQIHQADKKLSLCFILVFVSFQTISFRPTFITILLCLCQIYILEKYKTGNVKLLPLLALISILEINIHGMLWLFHILIMIAYIFPRVPVLIKTDEHDYKIKPLLIMTLIMMLTAFCNPYGFDMISSLWKSDNGIYTTLGVSEMQLLPIFTMNGILILSLIIVIIYLMIECAVPAEIFYLFAGLSLLGVTYMRNTIYAYIGIFMALIYVSKSYDFSRFHNFVNKQSKYFYIIGIIAVIIIALNPNGDYIYKEKDSESTPVKAIEYLEKKANKENIVLYTEFNNGSYFEYNEYLVYMESRGESSMEKLNGGYDIMHEYADVYRGCDKDQYKNLINKYNFTHLCINKTNHLYGYIDMDPSYEKVVDSEKYTLFEKK